MGVDIKVTTRPASLFAKSDAGRLPFEKIAAAILGSTYELSLVVCGDQLATRMNRQYRKKTYSPNVLSFPIEKRSGEIFLNLACAKREAAAYGVPLRSRLALLFVHGCFHLKGLSHGKKMESLERATLRRFGIHEK
ncbi:MAG: rRNA maturation RNase YbeY [Candidatus Kaiserbacteria bacterium]|nr:MAG: rRNA maturation RNase YbeY [Candidatus Kaiserbacteria bacterium]